MKPKGMLFWAGLLSVSCLPVPQLAVGADKQQEDQSFQTAELDHLINAIHLDLKQLKKDHAWLSGYNDKYLNTNMVPRGNWIYYYSKDPGLTQQPDHISITYCPIRENNEKGGKYWNVLEGVPACQFPSLALKIYAEIKVPDAKTADAIRNCIIQRCEALHKEMISQLPQPHYRRQASDPAWLETVVQVHGHLGPSVVAGARMGMIGLRAMEAKGYFDVEVTCEGPLAKPPQSCFLDGIQVMTGATLGKRNLQWVQADQLAVRITNTRTGKVAVLRPTPGLMKLLGLFKPQSKAEVGHGIDDEQVEAMGRKIAVMPDGEVASVTIVEGAAKKEPSP